VELRIDCGKPGDFLLFTYIAAVSGQVVKQSKFTFTSSVCLMLISHFVNCPSDSAEVRYRYPSFAYASLNAFHNLLPVVLRRSPNFPSCVVPICIPDYSLYQIMSALCTD
jgi:hypothetical protein